MTMGWVKKLKSGEDNEWVPNPSKKKEFYKKIPLCTILRLLFLLLELQLSQLKGKTKHNFFNDKTNITFPHNAGLKIADGDRQTTCSLILVLLSYCFSF